MRFEIYPAHWYSCEFLNFASKRRGLAAWRLRSVFHPCPSVAEFICLASVLGHFAVFAGFFEQSHACLDQKLARPPLKQSCFCLKHVRPPLKWSCISSKHTCLKSN